MKCIVKRPDYDKNYVFNDNGDMLAYNVNIPQNWMNSSGIARVQFSKREGLIIGQYAFYNSALNGSFGNDLLIPDNVSVVGQRSFELCDGINNVYLNLPAADVRFNALLNGPTGKLNVTQQYVEEFGGVGSYYDGMEVALWSTYPNLP